MPYTSTLDSLNTLTRALETGGYNITQLTGDVTAGPGSLTMGAPLVIDDCGPDCPVCHPTVQQDNGFFRVPIIRNIEFDLLGGQSDMLYVSPNRPDSAVEESPVEWMSRILMDFRS